MRESLLLSAQCPIFGIPLEVAPRALVARLNQAIAGHTLRSLAGEPVLHPVDALLTDPDQRIAYPVRDGVPCLKGYEAIALSANAPAASHAPQEYRKLLSEFDFWVGVRMQRGSFTREDAYLHVIERDFAIPRAEFRNARVLDIGCGPLGSLEWAELASLRVGLDPLADAYRQLGTGEQQMDYVAADAERIPFPADFFDFVLSFNSLDHVDRLDAAVAEIVRVLAPGGRLLLVTDIHDEPTTNEPTTFDWGVPSRFAPLTLEREVHLEKSKPGVYESIAAGTVFDHKNTTRRYGVLLAQLRKPTNTGVRASPVRERFVVRDSVPELRRVVADLPPHAQRVLFALLRSDIEHNAGATQHSRQGVTDFARTVLTEPPFALSSAALDREVARFYMRYSFHIIEILNRTLAQIATVATKTPREQQPQAMTQLLREIFGE